MNRITKKTATLNIEQLLQNKKCVSCQKIAQKFYVPDATSEILYFFCVEFKCFVKWAKKNRIDLAEYE